MSDPHSLRTTQLQCMIQCDPLMQKQIVGVYPADRIPSLKLNQGMIVNTDPHYLDGTHWLAIFNVNDLYLEIFDSLGIYQQTEFLKQTVRIPIKYSSHTIQCQNSMYCGYYCIAYLFYRVRGTSLHMFLDMFSDKCYLNDLFVFQFIYKMFPLCLLNHTI